LNKAADTIKQKVGQQLLSSGQKLLPMAVEEALNRVLGVKREPAEYPRKWLNVMLL
jgi:hypothetical protein